MLTLGRHFHEHVKRHLFKLGSLLQYIEMRYKSRPLRLLATTCNLINKFFYMGICLYAPSLALSTVTNLSTLASMVIMGGICTFYITVVSYICILSIPSVNSYLSDAGQDEHRGSMHGSSSTTTVAAASLIFRSSYVSYEASLLQ